MLSSSSRLQPRLSLCVFLLLLRQLRRRSVLHGAEPGRLRRNEDLVEETDNKRQFILTYFARVELRTPTCLQTEVGCSRDQLLDPIMLAECGTGCADEVNQERHDWVLMSFFALHATMSPTNEMKATALTDDGH